MTDGGPVTKAIQEAIDSGVRLACPHEDGASRSDYDLLFSSPLIATQDQISRVATALYDNSSIYDYEGWILADGTGHGERFCSENVVTWLLHEALEKTADKAWADLKYFLSTKRGESLIVHLVYGLAVDDELPLDCGYRIVPFRMLPYSMQKKAFELRHAPNKLWEHGGTLPCALIHGITMPVLFPPNQEETFRNHKASSVKRQENILGILAMLTLLGPPCP